MNCKKIIGSIILYLFIVASSSTQAVAITPPSFPSCTSPEGQVIAQYSSGTHGVPGSFVEHRGKDTVYKVSDDRLTQCLCTENVDGIQTNWWKISSITEADIATLKNLGWVFVPTGSVWGLEDTPYMAINSSFNCGGATTTTSSGGGSGSGGGGESPSVSGEVLGLATTGNIVRLYGLIALGSLSLILGLLLRKSKSKSQ